MATFPASLVTPEQVLLEEEVEAVTLRTDLGDATFLPGHTPLIGAVVPGLVRFVREGGSEDRFEIKRGLVQVTPERVVVLAPEAEPAT
jgi:F-type H+-transporting ATPase subunit epsilon